MTRIAAVKFLRTVHVLLRCFSAVRHYRRLRSASNQRFLLRWSYQLLYLRDFKLIQAGLMALCFSRSGDSRWLEGIHRMRWGLKKVTV